MDAESDTHNHMLGPFNDLTVDSEEIRSLQGLEAKVVVRKVSIVNDGRVKHVLIFHDDLVDVVGNHRGVLVCLRIDPVVKIGHHSRERLLGLLVQVGDGDTGSKDSIVRVLGGQVRSGLGGEVLLSARFRSFRRTSSSTVVIPSPDQHKH